jgi:hypothetical protein
VVTLCTLFLLPPPCNGSSNLSKAMLAIVSAWRVLLLPSRIAFLNTFKIMKCLLLIYYHCACTYSYHGAWRHAQVMWKTIWLSIVTDCHSCSMNFDQGCCARQAKSCQQNSNANRMSWSNIYLKMWLIKILKKKQIILWIQHATQTIYFLLTFSNAPTAWNWTWIKMHMNSFLAG